MESSVEVENFVTVVSVGNENSIVQNDTFPTELNGSAYVTVLTIGDSDDTKDVTEEVLVYRLPGERLGFGLKFEGGTKASEFVKRLFIQSCAADSPASRVKSSWGKLTEGDEVLEIDSIPVNSMTRIDCVRCLKDSNVVIKLLVRHFAPENKPNVQKTRSVEDIPLVISAEKKRIPPPPPPVPPRKIPRKFLKNNNSHENKENLQEINNNPVPTSRHIINDNTTKVKKFQSPRSSGRASYSPDVPRRDRRFSDGSLGPPDAEVYINLISQESTQSLSESDDTGSTISTVIDRFGSFPTTTTSSFAGSLPSTPTSVQKQLDLTNLMNFEDEDVPPITTATNLVPTKEDNVNGVPLQPPSCFQDAPLSYGNEDMRVIEEKAVIDTDESKVSKKPPVPPRSRDTVNGFDVHDENMNIPTLPRLVDFLPKATTRESIEVMKIFLENERRDNFNDEEYEVENYNNEIDVYSSKWSISPQLTTIGEVEEEGENINRSNTKSTPIVIVENADTTKHQPDIKEQTTKEVDGNMDTPPTDSRQPPDGHEFPDYVESNKLTSNKNFNMSFEPTDQDELEAPKEAIRPNDSSPKVYKSVENINLSISNFGGINNVTLNKGTSISNSDLSNIGRSYETNDISTSKCNSMDHEPPSNLHTRSQSLIDMSALSRQKNDKWNSMMEQRRNRLSKLKGLVIPENIAENEITPAINLPEIKSQIMTNVAPLNNQPQPELNSNLSTYSEFTRSSLSSPPWSSETSNLPKYSPAFKRKSLQVYTTTIAPKEKPKPTKLEVDENLSDPPKSLESITSPTRSDYSFDYLTSSKKTTKNEFKKESTTVNRLNKSEDESDNDSAVSSSQSSYISRCSPPASPTLNDYDLKTDDYNSQCRLLKPSSVEAINRKNILASAKCRSGRDLKVGSPVIRRKCEDSEKPNEASSKITEKVNNAFTNVDNIAKEIVNTTEKPDVQSVISVEANLSLPNGNGNITPPIKIETKIKEVPKVPDKEPPIIRKSLPLNEKIPPQINYRSSFLRKQPPPSVNDLRKNFEKFGSVPLLPQKVPTVKPTVSPRQVKSEILKTEAKITKQKIMSEPPKKVEEVKKKKSEEVSLKVVIPRRESVENGVKRKTISLKIGTGASLGITLNESNENNNREIMVQRIRYGSVAYQDGRLKRGDIIAAINGKEVKGLTQDEAFNILMESPSTCIIVIEESDSVAPSTSRRLSSTFTTPEIKSPPPKTSDKSITNVITISKEGGVGLGFSIEGGKDSPQGDVPLIIKKIFQGGPAEKSGLLKIGDEILSINDTSFANFSRIEAWNMMKKIPDGVITLKIHR